jgi:hypothetical protein
MKKKNETIRMCALILITYQKNIITDHQIKEEKKVMKQIM